MNCNIPAKRLAFSLEFNDFHQKSLNLFSTKRLRFAQYLLYCFTFYAVAFFNTPLHTHCSLSSSFPLPLPTFEEIHLNDIPRGGQFPGLLHPYGCVEFGQIIQSSINSDSFGLHVNPFVNVKPLSHRGKEGLVNWIINPEWLGAMPYRLDTSFGPPSHIMR